jgi:hypothetical protein
MERRPPTPVCRAFTLCKQIYTDPMFLEHTLVCPVHQVFAPEYPAAFNLSAFARWTNAHGAYRVELQLRTLDGEVVCSHPMDALFEVTDPLQIVMVTLRHLLCHFPAPGRYEVALLANEEDVATDTVIAHLQPPAPE